MAHTQIFYTNSARWGSQLAPGSSYDTINLLPSIWQGGGLKSIASIYDVGDLYNTDSWIPQTRRQTGSIIYDRIEGKYYKDTGGSVSSQGYDELTVLNGGSVSFAGITSSAGILITNGANISFSAGGNIATTGTASFGRITSSVLSQYYVPVANNKKGLVNSTIQDNGSLITLGRATYVGGNFKANGTASATEITASTGFHSLGTSYLHNLNATNINTTTIDGDSATFESLYVQGNTQLGKMAENMTSVFGTLSIVNAGSTSGSITCDSNGNLILDGSGVSSGVQITDGILWLGDAGSTGIQISSGSYEGTSYYGGMISSSMKIVALNGFANRTSDGAASFEVDINGNLQCASLKETSLRAYKHEIHYITESQLLNISKLKPITFLYNQDVPQDVNDTRLRQAGFIAEQVQQIYPEVAWYKDGKLAGLQYQRLTAYLTRGIQELSEQNKLLKSRVQSLEQLVNGILQGAK